MNLENTIWTTLNGGYKIPYDASIALKKLQLENDTQLNNIFTDLWNNLHHQGDVGLASYYAVPQLINICIEKKSVDWNFIGLCVLIENCRHLKFNPILPEELEENYYEALKKFEEYLLGNFKNIKDKESLHLTLAFFATINGQPELGRAIEKLDDDIIQELLEKYQ